MTISATLHKPLDRIDWITWRPRVYIAAFGLAMMAYGSWTQSAQDDAQSLAYKTRSTVQFEQVKKVAGANPVAAVKCLK